MAVIAMNRDLDTIMSRAEILFKRSRNTRYWIMISNDPYDKCFNFFFNSQRKNERLRSVPLHTIREYNLAILEEIINQLRKQTNFSIEFVGFAGQKFPKSQRIIQRGREGIE